MHARNAAVGLVLQLTRKRLVAIAIAFQFASAPARAIDEIQVYNAEIASPGQFTLQQHLNYIWSGNTAPDFPGGFASNRTLNGTPELAYGVTDWYEIGLYLPFSFDGNGTLLPGGVKVRQLFVSPHAENRKFFYGVNFELSYQSPRFSQSAIGFEVRPIIGLRDEGWEAILNPIFDFSFAPGGDAAFSPAARLARQIAADTWVGVEYYANYSPIGAIPSSDQQQHTLFGVVDFKLLGLDINFGVGFGLTSASDALVTKLIVGRAF